MPQREAHEAGHAVIARVLGVPVGWVVSEVPILDARRVNHGIEAYTQICSTNQLLRRWSYTMSHRSRATAIHALIITLMAGHIAECLIEEPPDYLNAARMGTRGSFKDMIDIRKLIDELGLNAEASNRVFRMLYRHTRLLVRRHETTIRRATTYLMAHKTIHGQEIDRLREGWMPEVKPHRPRKTRRKGKVT